MSTAAIAIQTENLTKSFGDRVAVKGLNLSIQQGEMFSLLGTNGAGKTTTIKMLSGLVTPSQGAARLNGLSITEHPLQVKAFIGVSPQETAIAAHLSSKENLLLMGGVFGMRRREAAQRAEYLMELLEIEDRRDQARNLSGGLKRRLSIAMALMSDPDILFLDEPTLGLDPHARKSVWTYIERLKGDKTILLTTHYLEEADALADTIAIMDQGRIIGMGTSAELKRKYVPNRTLLIQGKNLTDQLLAELNAHGFQAQWQAGQFEVQANQLDVYGLMAFLQQHGVEISALRMDEPSLDDVFLTLTDKAFHP